ncbi:MAG: enoyl-CoA hydratase [Anaerolineae bacterium]
MQIGDVISWERTFTREDIDTFTSISGDAGTHHVEPDEQGRLMVQGLLTATLPTKIGGDLNFIARELDFVFLRPVYAGDTIRCEVTLTELVAAERVTQLACTWSCKNQHGKEVMTGRGYGIVRPPAQRA